MKKLSVIMPFLKEGMEPIKTIISINNTTNPEDIEILAICDEPEYEYEDYIKSLFNNVILIKNHKTIGIDASRSVGINLASAPASLIIDGHMRFCKDDWVNKISDAVAREPRTLWCTKSLVLNDEMTSKQLDPFDDILSRNLHYSVGANFVISKNNPHPFGLSWNNLDSFKNFQDGEVPCVLGANYAGSTSWLRKIRAFEGLLGYGYSEQYVSIKNWLLGGKCKGLEDVGIAHIFRKTRPYSYEYKEHIYNILFTAYTLFPEELDFFDKYIKFTKEKNPPYQEALDLLYSRWDIVLTYQKYFMSMKQQKITELMDKFNISYMEAFDEN